jgi:hypothetical protein
MCIYRIVLKKEFKCSILKFELKWFIDIDIIFLPGNYRTNVKSSRNCLAITDELSRKRTQ